MENKHFFSIGHLAKAYGQVKREGENLIIEVDVYVKQRYSALIGFGLVTSMFFIFGLLFLIGSKIEGDYKEGIQGAAALWGFTIIFVGGQLFVMRHVVSNLCFDIEMDLKKIGKKKGPQHNVYTTWGEA